MSILYTKWVLSQDDVNAITAADEKISFSLQVNGSKDTRPVTWLQLAPWQETDIPLTDQYGAFVSSKTPDADTVLSTMSRFNVQLGTCYTWTGSDLKVDRRSTCSPKTIKMTNDSEKTWTFGLTKLDPKQLMNPINAQAVLEGQSAEFTPVPTVLVKVGSTKAGTVVGEKDVQLWQPIEITDLMTTLNFDPKTKQWSINKPDAKPDTKPDPDAKPDTKPDAKPDPKPDPDAKPDSKPDAKPDSKPDPDAKPDSKPDTKPDPKLDTNPVVKPGVTELLALPAGTAEKPTAKPADKPAGPMPPLIWQILCVTPWLLLLCLAALWHQGKLQIPL